MAIEGVSGTGLEAQSSQTDAVKSLIRWESPHPLSIAGVSLEFQRAFSPGLEHRHKWQLVPVSRRVRRLAAFDGAILLQFFGPATTGSGGVAYFERMRCDRTAEFPAFRVPSGQQTDIAEHRGEPPLDHTGSGMAFLAPGGDKRKLSRDDRVIDRHHLGEGEGRAEDLHPSVERLSPPLPGFLDADAVLQRTEHRLDGPAQRISVDDVPRGHSDLGGDEQTGRLWQAVFVLQPDPDGADRPAAEEFRQHDGGAIAHDLSLTIEEQEGAGLLQRGDGLFGHLRAILGGTPALADVARWRGPVESEVLPDLADDGQPFVKGEGDHRSPHEPGFEQQTALTEEAAHDPQKHPRTGQFAMVAGLADEPGNQWNRPARGNRLGGDDGGQGHPTLTPNVSRPVRLSAMVEMEADIRRLLRGPRHQRIVDDQIPDRRREVGDEDLAEALRDGNPGPLPLFQPFEIGGPLSARRDSEKGLGDKAPISNHGADEEFEEGQGGAVRNGLSQEG